MKIADRYGTVLRCYDNGGKTLDRYTIIPPRWAAYEVEQDITRYRGVRTFNAIAANAYPFHPQGFGQHVSAVPGAHLGKRVHWDALPADVQRFARQSFPNYAPKVQA